MEEVNRISSKKLQPATTPAAEETLVVMLQNGLGAAVEEVVSASYRSIELILIEMAHEVAFDTLFKQILDG